MQAWLNAYHSIRNLVRLVPYIFPSSSYLCRSYAEPLSISSEVIWTALDIDYPGTRSLILGFIVVSYHSGQENRSLTVEVRDLRSPSEPRPPQLIFV